MLNAVRRPIASWDQSAMNRYEVPVVTVIGMVLLSYRGGSLGCGCTYWVRGVLQLGQARLGARRVDLGGGLRSCSLVLRSRRRPGSHRRGRCQCRWRGGPAGSLRTGSPRRAARARFRCRAAPPGPVRGLPTAAGLSDDVVDGQRTQQTLLGVVKRSVKLRPRHMSSPTALVGGDE